MLYLFVPKLHLKSYKDLKIEKLKEKGIKAIVLDIDNTLVPFDVEKPDKEASDFLNYVIDSGVKPIVISNNHEKRVAEFVEGFDIPYYFESKKPLKRQYLKMQRDFDYKTNEIATMGDQLMTDVLGANRCGFYTILTHPLVKRDIFYTKPNRVLEQIMFFILKINHKFDKDVYDEM